MTDWHWGGPALDVLARSDLLGEPVKPPQRPTKVSGGAGTEVIALNKAAFARLHGPKSLEIIPGASHLFSEPDALEKVIELAVIWFERYLAAGTA